MPAISVEARLRLVKHYPDATARTYGYQTYTVMAGQMSFGTIRFSFETHLWSVILRHRTGLRAFEHESKMVVLRKLARSRLGRLATIEESK